MSVEFNATFELDQELTAEFIEVIKSGGEKYVGPYEATSLVNSDYELATKDKQMTANVTIRKIPFESVSNPHGGNTVTIGGY